MISVVQEWSGAIRSFLLNTNWDSCASDKLRWIREMDHVNNQQTMVQIDTERKVVELKLERKYDDLEYSAGKIIRIERFDAFLDLFYGAEMQ